MSRLLTTLPSPQAVTEAYVLKLFLAQAAARWMRLLHAMYQADSGTACDCGVERCALSFLESTGTEPATAFEAWVFTSLKQFRQEHPLPLGFRIAGLVDLRLADRITAQSLAMELRTRERIVRDIIRRRFHRSFHDYLTAARVHRAITLLATTDTKIEVIGLLVGYRSKKNFYGAIHRFSGQTPNQLRADMMRHGDNMPGTRARGVPTGVRRRRRVAGRNGSG